MSAERPASVVVHSQFEEPRELLMGQASGVEEPAPRSVASLRSSWEDQTAMSETKSKMTSPLRFTSAPEPIRSVLQHSKSHTRMLESA